MRVKYSFPDIKVPRFEESEGFYTSQVRRAMMSKIKSKNTKPETAFRRALHREGIRYRINYKGLPGTPDISNKTKKFVVFIDGEFWHGYNWEDKKKTIKSNRGFWIPKIERNIQRDSLNNLILEKMGYKVFRFWEHEVKKGLDVCVAKVLAYVLPND